MGEGSRVFTPSFLPHSSSSCNGFLFSICFDPSESLLISRSPISGFYLEKRMPEGQLLPKTHGPGMFLTTYFLETLRSMSQVKKPQKFKKWC